MIYSVPFSWPSLGKDFSLSARLFLNLMPQFDDNGLELVVGVRHMPVIPLPYTSIAVYGTWKSVYMLNVSHNNLSASVLGDFNYDRTSAHAALLLWQKTARRCPLLPLLCLICVLVLGAMLISSQSMIPSACGS